jgi:threonine dehydrogenase-like Zn-dependent dehydrogenase
MVGVAYGFAGMGPFHGRQAGYLRVPFGDFYCLRLPEDAQEKENDEAMLSDIFPTRWHCTRLANLQPGESVVIYGAGPVGLMAALSAIIQGASEVMVGDCHPDRLALAKKIGAILIDDSKAPAVGQVSEQTPRRRPRQTRAREGEIASDMGLFWFKGQKVGTGQANVKRYNRHLRSLIHTGRAKPSWIISHELPLTEAPNAYQHFMRDNGWTKVVLKPELVTGRRP